LKRVEAVPAVFKGKMGYNIKVNDPRATLQDYIDAVEMFISGSGCFRSRKPELETCYGCDLCCQERIPVTMVDVFNLTGPNVEEAFKKFLHVYVDRRVVDITMALDGRGKCIFLDNTKGTCTVYNMRPLVCRTFICCPSTGGAKKLREEIVNTGEDELVRSWFLTGENGITPIIHEGVSPSPDISDYPPTPFARTRDYNKIRIKDVCSPQTWKRLTTTNK